MAEDKIRLKIDGVEVEASRGQMVIEAARAVGISIPYLCWHPILKPYGACRMCVVEVKGGRGMPASCHTEVAEGMDVVTDSPAIGEVRRDILALTLTSHPHGCLTCWRIDHCGPADVCLRNVSVTDRCVVCPQNERCELQDVTYSIKLDDVPLPYEYRQMPLETRSPFIDHDMNLCIVCGKCVRACDELEGANAITFENRGNRTVVGTSQGGTLADSGCTFCGICVDVCPVGAITEKDSKWAGAADKFVTSACAQCSVGCTLNLNVKDGKLIRATHDIEGSSVGQECVQGKFGYKWVYSKNRLSVPMLRERGELREATWDEALDAVAEGLGRFQPDEIAILGSAKVTNEDNFVLQRFARGVLGVNNIDFIDPLCPPNALEGLARAFGSTAATGSMWDIRGARAVLVVDSDLTFEQPVAGLQVKEAVRRGAHLIVIDPRDTELGELASERLVCRPDTEVAVLGGIMRAILDDELQDADYVQRRTQELEALRESLSPFTLDAVEKLTGVAQSKIAQAARLLATNKPGAMLFSPSLVGEDDSLGAAVANLALLTGNVGTEGAGVFPLRGENNSQGAEDMGCRPHLLPGGESVGSVAAWLRAKEAWGDKVPQKPGLDYRGILAGIRQGKIKALVLLGENQVLPDPTGELAEALGKLEFLVVHEAFLQGGLADHAHVALPAPSFAEREGTYTSFERRIQKIRAAIKLQGQARPAWQVISTIANKMGSALDFRYEGPADIMDEIASMAPTYGGVSYQRLDIDSIQWPCSKAGDSGTAVLHAERFSRGLGRFQPMAWPGEPKTTQIITVFQSIRREVKGSLELNGVPAVEFNAEDASRLRVRTGDQVNLMSAMGDIKANVKVNGRAPLGVALLTLPHEQMVVNLWNKPTPGRLAPFSRAKRYPVRVERPSA